MRKANVCGLLIPCLIIACFVGSAAGGAQLAARPTRETPAAFSDWNWEGQATSYQGPLPWGENPGVLSFLAKHGAPVLLAAFKAVLREPIGAEPFNIALAAEKLSGTILPPGAIFSQNQTIGPYTAERGYRAGPTYMGNRYVTTVRGWRL